MSEKNIEISFRLPTCLYIRDGFKFNIEKNIFVKVTEVREQQDVRFGSVHNMEVYSDTNAAFRFSVLTVIIPDTNPNIPDENLRETYRRKIIEVTNKFIDTYRFFSKRYSIANIQDLKDMYELKIQRVPGNTVGEFMFSFGKGSSLRTLVPICTEENHIKLQNLLNQSIPLEQLFIMDAERHNSLGHYPQALLGAVIALEITVNSFTKIHIPKFLKFFLRQKNLEYRLGKIIDKKEDLDLIKGAVRKRNSIVHDGDRKIDEDILEKYIGSIKKIIEQIKPVIK